MFFYSHVWQHIRDRPARLRILLITFLERKDWLFLLLRIILTLLIKLLPPQSMMSLNMKTDNNDRLLQPLGMSSQIWFHCVIM